MVFTLRWISFIHMEEIINEAKKWKKWDWIQIKLEVFDHEMLRDGRDESDNKCYLRFCKEYFNFKGFLDQLF